MPRIVHILHFTKNRKFTPNISVYYVVLTYKCGIFVNDVFGNRYYTQLRHCDMKNVTRQDTF